MNDIDKWINKHKNHLGWFIVELDTIVLIEEVEEELEEIEPSINGGFGYGFGYGYWWAFEKEEDAVQFKLRWG